MGGQETIGSRDRDTSGPSVCLGDLHSGQCLHRCWSSPLLLPMEPQQKSRANSLQDRVHQGVVALYPTRHRGRSYFSLVLEKGCDTALESLPGL